MTKTSHFYLTAMFAAALFFDASAYEFHPSGIRHGVIMADTTGQYSYMWPLNNGMWSWGPEIVVHFSRMEWPGDRMGAGQHERFFSQNNKLGPNKTIQARSRDNGETWEIGEFDKNNAQPPERPINFSSPGFGMKVQTSGTYVTYDKAKTWIGPYDDFKVFGTEHRPDHVFTKDDGKTAVTVVTGRGAEGGTTPPAAVKTTNAGLTWSLSGIWPKHPHGHHGGVCIQPQTVRLGENELLSVGRSCGQGALYRSTDFGESWAFERDLCDMISGHHEVYWVPCDLVVLGGGYPGNTNTSKVVAVWGARSDTSSAGGPFVINGSVLPPGPRTRYSNDGGRTWSDNVVQLRRDIGDQNGFDTGYLLATQRTDGKIIAIYYWQTNELPQPHIAYTVFDPNIVTD